MKDGKSLPEQISEADIQDDRFMMPVLPEDALIMCLDDLPPSDGADGKGKAVESGPAPEAGETAALQAQLDEITRQFANYRLAVEQTLDKRWHAEDDDSSSTSSAAPKREKEDSSQSYWEGYANHGMFLRDEKKWARERSRLMRWKTYMRQC